MRMFLSFLKFIRLQLIDAVYITPSMDEMKRAQKERDLPLRLFEKWCSLELFEGYL